MQITTPEGTVHCMARKTTSLRLEAELLDWAQEYADERGVSRTAVFEEGLRTLRGLAKGGVPDLPTSAEELEAPHIASVREMQPAEARTPSWIKARAEINRGLDERQRKLNDAKYGRRR